MQIYLNDVRMYEAVLRNHPHDARGVLSYWRGGVGAYGYLANAHVGNGTIEQIARNASDHSLRLRCAVPAEAMAQGGLTIYGAECGRFPICPTVIVEW
jgi:predicted transcriptional regulator